MSTYQNAALSSTASSVKVGAGALISLSAQNPNAADAYLQVFDAASAPTVGTATPLLTIWLPALQARERIFAIQTRPNGRPFNSGIYIAATTTPSGSTAPASAVVVEDAEYF